MQFSGSMIGDRKERHSIVPGKALEEAGNEGRHGVIAGRYGS